MAVLADVVVDRVVETLDHPFTYAVGEALEKTVAVGQLVEVPFGRTKVIGVVWRIFEGDRSPQTKDLDRILDAVPVVTPALLDLAEWLSERYLCYISQALRAMIPVSVRNQVATRPKEMWYRAVGVRRGRASLKQSIFEYLERQAVVDRRTLVELFPMAPAALRALVAEGAIEVAAPPEKPPETVIGSHALTPDQSTILGEVLSHPGRSWLLEGVTGSGKTEVYLAVIADALSHHQQALVLLPEIALTPQIVMRFRERFGSQVAVWHSGLTAGERRSTWQSVRDGSVAVVVGARSAVFLPFSALGVMVLDEEHEPSYKQEDHPRYHAREVALWRGKREQATVILGSATPSVETRYRAEAGQLGHLWLPQRVLGRTLPKVSLVDMREELRQGNRDIFSDRLKDGLAHVLDQGQQAILFLNRRGYSTFVLCRSCGQALECTDCAVSLTYHQKENRLVCHYCMKERVLPKHCPACGSDKIRYFGAGTERVADEVQKLFVTARVLRADRDTLTHPDDYANLYQSFLRGEADVLVGTQMIAKGMDFPRVSLVGVVAADTALHLPDYRSAERTFQLLVQAGGRSGRGEIPGEVIIQTYNPDHYAIFHAIRHDFESFYREEIQFRQATDYPPYRDLWLLVAEGPEESGVRQRTQDAVDDLRVWWPDAAVLGPAPAPLARVRGQYRYHVLVKESATAVTDAVIADQIKQFQLRHPGISVTRDPYFLM